MAKGTIMDDLFALGAKLPWKLSLVLAIGSAIGLHQLSLIEPPAYRPQEFSDYSANIWCQRRCYLVPLGVSCNAAEVRIYSRKLDPSQTDSLLYLGRNLNS